jgi:hypothetical protein
MTTVKWNGEDRRQNYRLHTDDIALIVTGVTQSLSGHYCRFPEIKTDDLD